MCWMNEVGKQRVLVVDDDPRIIRFIRASLMAHGYDVLTATNGEEALEVVKMNTPDIMLLDIRLPVKDGFEVLQELRTFSSMPVIAFSANSSVSKQALSLGANDFVSKPFTPDEMIERTRSILNRTGK
jgi:two-component system KDP operon response regulator KdpE